ncbi:hypothetical protein IA539_23220 [Gordonia sp. zg691]|uniref:GDSL-type esterase/lipase family protein n=1 Tax=Gordonia jinghuaiqii TaxID=2758710 RepID=UPI00166259E8|nr:GDSL-type esterase/lipase family protein [Gordonia jinghuaiqii]MBD0864079.1 hypothetical protein [Gordonia jinghuaiqii]
MSSTVEQRRDSTRSGLAGDAARRILARVASSAMLGIFLLLLARQLTVDSFGQYILAYTVGMVIGLAAGFGAPVQVMRVSATGGSAAAARLYVVHSVSVSAVFLIAVGGLLYWELPAIVVAGGVFAYSDTVGNFAQNFLAGIRAHTAASCLVVAQRALPLIAWGALVAGGRGIDASSLICIFGITAAVALLVPAVSAGLRVLHHAITAFDDRSERPAAPFWALSVSGVLSQLQVSALALFAPPLTVGYFAMATRVTGPLTLLSAAMSTVVVPELSDNVDDGSTFSRIYRRYRNGIIAYCVLVVLAAWPISWVILQIIGTKYDPAQPMLVGMIVAAGISSISQAISAKYIAVGRPNIVTTAIVAGGSATLALLALAGHLDRLDIIWLIPIAGQLLVLAAMLSDSRTGGTVTRSYPTPPALTPTDPTPPNRQHAIRKHGEKVLLLLAVVAVAVTVVLTLGVHGERDQPAVAAETAAVVPTATGSDAPVVNTAGESVTILVVGDSFTEGTAYGGKGSSNWTRIAQSRLSGERLNACPVLLRVSGRGGAGYLTAGVRHTTFVSEAERLLTRDVSAIVVVGSGNDLSHPLRQYRTAVNGTIRAIKKARPQIPVVIVGLSWIHDQPVAGEYRDANAVLAGAAKRNGATFVDPITAGWYSASHDHSIVGSDLRHPTDEGHAIIADRMTPILENLGRQGTCE